MSLLKNKLLHPFEALAKLLSADLEKYPWGSPELRNIFLLPTL
jgi:hypothetical protein